MKNYFVTGVSQGLGLCIAETLLKEGARVFGIYRKDSKDLIRIKKQYPDLFFTKVFDLINPLKIKNYLFKDFIPPNIAIDGYVNNAAIAYDDIITNINFGNLERMYKINVFTPIMITKEVIRRSLLHNNPCAILHISSISVHTGYKGLAMYASTKGALEAFSKNTAREWGTRKIRSNTVVCGFMETSMSASLSNDQKDRIYKRTAMKKATDPFSVANTVSFLLSEKSHSITGQNIYVDSGTI